MGNPINASTPRGTPPLGPQAPAPASRGVTGPTRADAVDALQLSSAATQGGRLVGLARVIEEARRQVAALDQGLAALEAVRGGAAEGPPSGAAEPQLPAGQGLAVARLDRAKAALREQLTVLDGQIVEGAAPETVAADRARLLTAAEALEALGQDLLAPRPAPASARERAELEKALAQVAALADRLGQGEHPGALRPQLYVARQGLKDPVGSQHNGAIQAAAAALGVIGQAEADLQAQRSGLAAAVAGGIDPRTLDLRVAALGRQAEDLEVVRLGIEGAGLDGLTPEQVARGVALIGQLQGVAQAVAGGQDLGVRRQEHEDLVQQLRALRQPPAAVAPALGPPAPPASQEPAAAVPPAGPASQEPAAAAPPAGPASQEPAAAVPPADPASQGAAAYVVRPGEHLSKIAREQLGDGNRWREIVALNQARYPGLAQNPDLIHPGWTLQLPPREGEAPRGLGAPVSPSRQP
ncbi:MAG: LysM peptidoglycan-binding domain-containing protein [Candidatus Sericytochromatia bacterium]|nr:LysM peptidoglycan-binding domain-containing protein [Candidatus Sericytochromatia bacterium]